MSRGLPAAALVLAWAGLLILSPARPVVACSAGPDFNPVTDSTVIVAGRISGWEVGEPVPVPPPAAEPGRRTAAGDDDR